MRVRLQLLTSVGDSPAFRSNAAVFSMISTRASGPLRLSTSPVAAPENAPPIITTSYSSLIVGRTQRIASPHFKGNQFRNELIGPLDVGLRGSAALAKNPKLIGRFLYVVQLLQHRFLLFQHFIVSGFHFLERLDFVRKHFRFLTRCRAGIAG